ncbi:hypothetical protein IKG50_02550 [Candidatus Saccharibacteria bacterium]|nr:hypothetical protein [Candidatus Saccharibacteria bacterium]
MKKTREKRSRKILPIIFGVVGFLAIGGTIAVNQSTHIFDNLFHVDEVTRIDFVETFDSPDDWQPCQEIPKTAIARNEEGVTVNLRLKYDEYWLSKEGEDMPLQKDGDSIAIINFQNQADWEDGGDGWYYYKHQLAPGDESNSFFKSVTMNCGMNMSKELKYCENDDGTDCDKDISEYSEATYHIFIRMQTYWGEQPPADQYNVSIDPNGGTFNDSGEVYTTRVDKGTEIDLSDIERSGYDFVDWTLNGSSSYTDSTITINGDTSLVANWEQSGPQVARIERTGRIYPSIMAAHNEAQANDIITLLVDTEEVVTNEKTVTLNLDGHTVTGSLTNTVNGDLTVLDGEINNPNGIAVTNNGTLTVGINDYDDQNAAIVVNDYVRFIGTTVGLNQNGTFNYYDGYLEGDIGLNGGYNDTPFYHQTGEIGDIHYHPLVSYIQARDIHHVELSANDNAVSKTIVGGEVFYYDLQDNINVSAETGYQIYAVRDFDAAYTITVPENTEIVFDIAGYNVVFKNVATNNGDFTILNSSTESGSLKTEQTMDNEGDLTIRDMTIVSANANTTLKNGGKLILRNAIVTNSNTSYALETKSGGSYDLDADSAIVGNRSGPKAIYNDTSDFEWTNGTIYGNILNTATATATISGGTIDTTTGRGWETCAIDGGTVVINDGATIKSQRSFACNAELTINGGTITAGPLSGAAVNNSSNSKNTYINGGTITINGMGSSAFSFGKNVTQTGGDVSVISSSTGKGTVGYSQIVNMSGGTLYVENNGNYANVSTAQGIQATGGEISGGTITVVNKKKLPAIGVSAKKISGGTINVTSNTGTAIGIENTATITGGTVTANTNSGTAYGISNTSGASTVSGVTATAIANTTGTAAGVNASSNITITSGKFEGTTYGILASGGTTKLGDNDGNVDIEHPEIIGGNLGLSGSSINFFDGIIKGGTYAIGEGAISAIPDGYTYHKETIDDKENCWLVEMTGFLEVDGNTYSSFEDAYNAISGDTGTVKVITDADLEAAIPNSPSGKTVTIDLNGHKLNTTQSILSGGSLILTDSSQAKTGELTNTNTSAISGTGSISVISTTVTGNISSSSRNGSVAIDDSTINGYARYTGEYGSMTINNSLITSSSNVVYCSSSRATVTIGGNTKIFAENIDNVATTGVYTQCNTTIKDTVDVSVVSNLQSSRSQMYAINNNGGTLTIKDNATISALAVNNASFTQGIYSKGGTVILEGGTITSRDNESTYATVYGIRAETTGMSISDGAVVTAEAYSGSVFGIYTYYSREFSMTGGQITAHGDYSTTKGIFFDYGTQNISPVITGGTISAYSDRGLTSYGIQAYNFGSNNGIIIKEGTINGKKYGIYSDLAPVTIGDNSDRVNIDNPSITGGEYALHNNDRGAVFSFYDGVLKGGTEAYYPDSISSIPDGYTYHKETIDDKENCWLVEASDYLEVDGATYNSLGNAYNAITGDSGTITVIEDATVQAVHPDSPEGKTITLDLNGHTLSYSQPIINKSTMIIQDSSQEQTGAIIGVGSSTSAIKNYTDLTINSGNLSSSYRTIHSIYGSTLTMNGGTITSTNAGVYCVDGDYEKPTTINLNNGSITADSATAGTVAIYCGNGVIHMKNNFSVAATSTAGAVTGVSGNTLTIEDDATISVSTECADSSASAQGAQAGYMTISDNAVITAGAKNGPATGISSSNMSISSGTITASSLYGNSYAATGGGSITGGTISAESQYYGEAYGVSFGSGTISGGNISAQSDKKAAKGVTAAKNTIIQGGTITAIASTGTSYGVYGKEYTITGGTIAGMYGAYTETSAPATIGSNDGTLDRTKPIITSSIYALSGVFNFYDGTLRGEIKAFEGSAIKTIADDSSMHSDTVTEGGVTYQECYLVASYDVAQIGGSAGTRYKTLQAAVDAALEDDIIDIIGENYMFYSLTIPAEKVITIDMHGYDTWSNNPIVNNGKVGIINSAHEIDSSTITLEGGSSVITNNEGAELAVHNVDVDSAYVAFRNNGTLDIDGIEAVAKAYSLNNKGSGATTVNNSTLYGSYYSIYSENGTVDVQNSVLKGSISVQNNRTTIKDSVSGPIDEEDTSNSINLSGTGELIFDNVQHTSRYHNNQSRPSSTEYTINTIPANTSFTAKNSSLTLVPLSDTNVYIDFFENRGSVNIDNSTVTLDTSKWAATGRQVKMIQNAGTINFPSGEITAFNNGNVYGIFNTNTGTITMGVPDDNPDTRGTEQADVSTTNPAINANVNNTSRNGVGITNNSGVINFYDGRVTGRTVAISSGATQTEYMYELREFTDENGNKYMILVWTPNS